MQLLMTFWKRDGTGVVTGSVGECVKDESSERFEMWNWQWLSVQK